MKAIVVRQPWATLIALGVKSIETRPSPPNGPMRPEGVRGLPGCSLERGERIAIVAAAQAAPPEPFVVGDFHIYRHDARDAWLLNANETKQWDLPLGAVVCTVVVDDAVSVSNYKNKATRPNTHRNAYLVDCPHDGDLPHQQGGLWLIGQSVNRGTPTRMADQLPLGDFTPGRWGWLLTDPQPCEPIPCKGRQGVFELPAEVADALAAAVPVQEGEG